MEEGFELRIDEKLREEKESVLSTPVEALDLDKVSSVEELVEAFSGMSIQARNVGLCAKVFEGMLTDPDRPTILLGLAGPLIAAGLREVIRSLIVHNLVDVVVSTGAIIYQDIYQARGFKHYAGTPDADDSVLRDLLIDRIYDTYVDEEKFWETDIWIGRFADKLEERNYSSREFLSLLSGEIDDEKSILKTATEYGVPIFCPALNDSSIGIGLTEHYHRKVRDRRKGFTIDPIRDNYEISQIVYKSKTTSAAYIAGGVPKNYINDSVIMTYIFGRDTGGHRYAFQLTTAQPTDGGLSGSTLSEATSWGKVSKKATRAMAFVEPSVSLPLVAAYAIKRGLGKNRSRLKLTWDGDILSSLQA